jgi:glycosyltransferase involved in cell wall biosynthesis
MNKDLIDDRFGRFREIPLVLARSGHKVTGLCLSYKHKNEEWLSDETVRWKSINAGLFKIFGLIRFIVKARNHTKKADIIWACSDSFYGIIGYLLSIRYGVPMVFDLYDNFEFFLAAKLPIMKQLYLWSVRKCAAVTCVSRPLAGLVGSYGRKSRIFVLENAVRKELFIPMPKSHCRAALGLPKSCKLVGTAGALEKSRGIQNLFEAFDLLKTRRTDLHLVLAGARKINLPQHNRIHDLGVLPLQKVPLLLNALDVAVICNRDNRFGRYCFPQKAAEIMACNVPLIAARVGSMAELFKDHPKWLFTPDNNQDLADAIEHRIGDRTTAYRFATSWKDASKKLENTFSDILTQNR